MKKLKSLFMLIPIFLFLFLLEGCGKPVINNEADEIKLYSWEYTGKQGINSTLKFSGDEAILTIVNDNEKCRIQGLCVFGDTGFVIIDPKLQNEYGFKYKLSGRELSVSYNGSTIKMQKTAPSNNN